MLCFPAWYRHCLDCGRYNTTSILYNDLVLPGGLWYNTTSIYSTYNDLVSLLKNGGGYNNICNNVRSAGMAYIMLLLSLLISLPFLLFLKDCSSIVPSVHDVYFFIENSRATLSKITVHTKRIQLLYNQPLWMINDLLEKSNKTVAVAPDGIG